jgi:RNA polymerase sigma-70 factor (ECF subfamily)
MTTTETIWKDYYDRLSAFIRSRVADRATADDILQDVFLKVHTALPSRKEGSKLQGWLYQVARNAVIDHYRSRRPQEPLPEWLAQPTSEPSEAARRELAACLRPMMDQLPAPYREALTLSDLENRSQREVWKTQGLSLSGAKSRVQRGRAMVKDLLRQCCQLEFDHRGALADYEPEDRPCGSC